MHKILMLSVALISAASMAQAASVNLITNGDFEAGDTGFTTELTLGGGLAQYRIATTPKAANSAFINKGDHTSGTGNMMVINGARDTDTIAWSQTVSVEAGATYEFSAYSITAFNGPLGKLDFVVDGTSIGMSDTPAFGDDWTESSFSWTAGGTTSVVLTLLDASTEFGGNDYAIDDLSFVKTSGPIGPAPVPLPGGLLLLGTALAGGLALKRRRRH